MRKAILIACLVVATSSMLSGCFLGHFRGQGNTFAGDETAAGSDTSEEVQTAEVSSLR